MKIMVLNGPNLNLLGSWLPDVYGTTTLSELERQLADFALRECSDVELYFLQTNHEGQLIDFIQKARVNYDGIIYNPAAHGAYSLALRDAVEAATIPVVEVLLGGSGDTPSHSERVPGSVAAESAAPEPITCEPVASQFVTAPAPPFPATPVSGSLITAVAVAQFEGCGVSPYRRALSFLVEYLRRQENP
ncbi:MAG: type II 3-dehydroquinate dehydratase [Coriobacteriales bacterium]|jgi:3-dehydroquinate dehydratase|nr:type II 3-dehydroquinate dehydratase [Coriobacteriales bacterium]